MRAACSPPCPAAAGGYGLLGLAVPMPELFQQIAWGTEAVLAATLARLPPPTPQLETLSDLDTPDSADPEDVYRRARVFDGVVDAINATDGSGANCHMSSLAVCSLLTRKGYAPVMQISCRDKNRIAIQGDILGGAAMGVCNMLCLTGDGVQAGDHPQAKPVFDLDCMSLLEIGKGMRDTHRFQSGRKVTFAPRVFFGAAANPFVQPFDWRAGRLACRLTPR
jgi:methylenetetrahydrofolate reductase (NADPH)